MSWFIFMWLCNIFSLVRLGLGFERFSRLNILLMVLFCGLSVMFIVVRFFSVVVSCLMLWYWIVLVLSFGVNCWLNLFSSMILCIKFFWKILVSLFNVELIISVKLWDLLCDSVKFLWLLLFNSSCLILRMCVIFLLIFLIVCRIEFCFWLLLFCSRLMFYFGVLFGVVFLLSEWYGVELIIILSCGVLMCLWMKFSILDSSVVLFFVLIKLWDCVFLSFCSGVFLMGIFLRLVLNFYFFNFLYLCSFWIDFMMWWNNFKFLGLLLRLLLIM